MLRLMSKNKLFSLERIWFEDANECSIETSKSDVVRFLRCNTGECNSDCYIVDVAMTLCSDLSMGEEDLLQKMNKTVKYEIKKCMSEDVKVNRYESKDIQSTPQIVNSFYTSYISFCEMCGNQKLKKDFDLIKINSYIENDCILITTATYEHGAVYHMYVHDSKNAVLVYSASDFRNETVNKNLAGRANKLLHYKDMLYFKQKSLTNYDWGNVSSFENPNGIDIFKMSFGGEHREVYNIFVGNTAKGRILVTLKKFNTAWRKK